MKLLYFFIIYLIIINFYGYLIMYIDKKKSIKQKYRISENRLFMISMIGGSIGIYIGMKYFRHKTLKKRFKYGIPLIIFLQILIIYYIFYY